MDFALIDDDALSSHEQLRVFLKALKYVLRPDLPDRLELLLVEETLHWDAPNLWHPDDRSRNGDPTGRCSTTAHLSIVRRCRADPPLSYQWSVSLEAVREAQKNVMSNHAEETIQALGQRFFEKGFAVGMAQAVAKRAAEALVLVMERRIGPVSEPQRARILAADLVTIAAWFDRAIEATDFESVFDHPTTPSNSAITSA